MLPYQQQIGFAFLALGGVVYLWQNRAEIGSKIAWATSFVRLPSFAKSGPVASNAASLEAFDVLKTRFKSNPEAMRVLKTLWPYFLDDAGE
jgi:hypothetical protein